VGQGLGEVDQEAVDCYRGELVRLQGIKSAHSVRGGEFVPSLCYSRPPRPLTQCVPPSPPPPYALSLTNSTHTPLCSPPSSLPLHRPRQGRGARRAGTGGHQEGAAEQRGV
jgi:hypothetical protein